MDAGEESVDIRSCKFEAFGCPAEGNASRCPDRKDGDQTENRYCACAYTGPLCGTCERKHFVSWAGSECKPCGDSESHIPTIGLAAGVAVLGAAALVTTGLLRNSIKASARFERLRHFKRLGWVKAQILFYMGQVISEFARISSDTSKSGEYKTPASTFAGALSVTNLDVLGFGEFYGVSIVQNISE